MMNAKKYLYQYRNIDDNINDLLEEVAHWRALSTKTTPPERFEDNGTHSDRVGTAAARIADLEKAINAEVDRLVDVRNEIIGTISEIENTRYRTLIVRYYILRKSWEQVSESFGVSNRTIYYWHINALKIVERILRKNKKF